MNGDFVELSDPLCVTGVYLCLLRSSSLLSPCRAVGLSMAPSGIQGSSPPSPGRGSNPTELCGLVHTLPGSPGVTRVAAAVPRGQEPREGGEMHLRPPPAGPPGPCSEGGWNQLFTVLYECKSFCILSAVFARSAFCLIAR